METPVIREQKTPRQTNRHRILAKSIALFNEQGIVAITTNHIADALNISPGNLYFHFRNKEQIILELYQNMRNELYDLWESSDVSPRFPTPFDMIRETLEVFWKYRFFHREMYHLRRKDPQLSKLWKAHIQKSSRLIKLHYIAWCDHGIVKPINDPQEMQLLTDLVLITANAFLNFYESPERPATRSPLNHGLKGVGRLLMPYHTPAAQEYLLQALK